MCVNGKLKSVDRICEWEAHNSSSKFDQSTEVSVLVSSQSEEAYFSFKTWPARHLASRTPRTVKRLFTEKILRII